MDSAAIPRGIQRDPSSGATPSPTRPDVTSVQGRSRSQPCSAKSTYRHYAGAQRLREFERAPESVQAAFWRELARWVAAEHGFDRYLAWLMSDAPLSEEPVDQRARLRPGSLRWDERWERRARSARVLLAAPERRPFPNSELVAMLEVPASVYVEKITGEEAPERGAMACPLPDHDDRSPSFQVYELGWRCYGCAKSGTIYTLASILWDLEQSGPQFVELHNRLKAALA